MIVLPAQEPERRLNVAFSTGKPTALRRLLFRVPKHARQVGDFAPPDTSAAASFAKGVGHDDNAIANT
jgi:hypothetical protein